MARSTRRAAATSWPARWPPSPACPSPGGAAWTRARLPAGSPTCCCGPAPRTWSRSTSGYGQLAWALQTDERVTVLDRVNVRTLTPEQVAPAAGPGHGGPVLHLAHAGTARPGRLRGPGRRLRADGEAAVRGRQGQRGGGRRGAGPGAAGRRGQRRGRGRRGHSAWAWRESRPARCPARPGTWSTSCGCAAARRRWTTAALRQAIADRPAVTANGADGPGHAPGRAHRAGRAALRGASVLVAGMLTAAGIAVRVLEPEAADLNCARPPRSSRPRPRRPRRGDGPGPRRRRHAAAGGRDWPGRPGCRCSASTSGMSASSPRPSRRTWPRRVDRVIAPAVHGRAADDRRRDGARERRA